MVSLKNRFTVLRQSQKEDFLPVIYYNVLLAWCLAMAQIQFSLTKKIKIGHPEHSLAPHPPTSNNISFLLYPLLPRSPLKVDVTCLSPLKGIIHTQLGKI